MPETFPVCHKHPDWPEARFNLSGLFMHEPIIFGYLRFFAMGFSGHPPIATVHGAPAVAWNGGRISPTGFRLGEFARHLQAFNAQGIGCFLTFTNHLIEPADLADVVCNQLLDCISGCPDLNGVIVASDLLSAHISRRYPALRQAASIIKVTMENGRGNPDYYRQLGERFWRYMVHPDDCRDVALLDQLDREKAEVIVNEPCGVDCPLRPAHYDRIAGIQKQHQQPQVAQMGSKLIPELFQVDQGMPGCGASFQQQLAQRRRNCHLGQRELKAVYDLGFRQFKLQGRRDRLHTFIYDLVRFTLEPQIVAPLMTKVIFNAIRLEG